MNFDFISYILTTATGNSDNHFRSNVCRKEADTYAGAVIFLLLAKLLPELYWKKPSRDDYLIIVPFD